MLVANIATKRIIVTFTTLEEFMMAKQKQKINNITLRCYNCIKSLQLKNDSEWSAVNCSSYYTV